MSHFITPDFDAIPKTLQNAGRWACWKGIKKKKGNGFDKRPYVNGVAVSTANPEKWLSFEEAQIEFLLGNYDGVGVLIDNNLSSRNIVGLDFDHVFDKSGNVIDREKFDAAFSIGGYIEYSPSGTGLRVFGYSSELKYDSFQGLAEIYVGQTERYLTATGANADPLNGVDIYPLNLSGFKIPPKPDRAKAGEIPPILPTMPAIPEGVSPDILDQLSNGFDRGQDRSRALARVAMELRTAGCGEQELLSILYHSPGSYEIASDHRRGKEDKIIAYLYHHHVAPAVSRVDPIDIEDLDSKTKATSQAETSPAPKPNQSSKPQSRFPSPVPFKEKDVSKLDGLLKETVDWFLSQQRYQQPLFALAAALSLFETIGGSSYRGPTGLANNTYTILVAPTGGGKNAPLNALKRALAEVGLSSRFGGDSLASGPGLEDLLARAPEILVSLDEAGKTFEGMYSQKASDFGLTKSLLALYTSSTSIYKPRAKAGGEEREDIIHPHVTLFGATTASSMSRAFTNASLEDGLTGRVEFLEAEGAGEKNRSCQTKELPKSVIDAAKDMASFFMLTNARQSPLDIGWTDEAANYLEAYEDRCRALAADPNADPAIRAAHVRAAEHALKRAQILAVIEDYSVPLITLETAKFAVQLAELSVRFVTDTIAPSIGEDETRDSKTLSRITRVIRAGHKGAQSGAYQRLLDHGAMPKALLLRKLKCKARDLTDLIDTLVESKAIKTVKIKNEKGIDVIGYKLL